MASVVAQKGVKAEGEDEVVEVKSESEGEDKVVRAEADVVRGRVVRAVVLPCGAKGNFKGEVYEFAEPVQAEDGLSTPGFFFWLFRWLVDFLGGNQIPNFGGRSRATLLGRTASLLADGLSSRQAKVPIAEQHLTVSSIMSRLSGAKRKSGGRVDDEDVEMEVKDDDEELEAVDVPGDSFDEAKAPRLRGDFALSSFAMLVWMSKLMVSGPRAGSRWMLDSAELKGRCRAFLQGLSDTFWQNVQGDVFQVVRGELAVDVLTAAEGKLAAKIFNKKKTVSVVAAMATLQGDVSRRSLSADRRRLAEKLFSRLLQSLAKAIDDSRGQDIWTASKVETARGYRKVSHGCQEAVLEAGRSAGPSVAAALAAQGHFSGKAAAAGGKEVRRNKERPGKFLEAERLSYVAAGRASFAQTTVLSVVADAVHVGTEDWLNVFVCDPGQNLSFVCPPQAVREGGLKPFTREGTVVTKEWVDLWQGRLTSFFKAGGGRGRGRAANRETGGTKQPERLATQDWLRDVSHSLGAIGWGWSSCGRSETAAAGARPVAMVFCTDQEATQLSALSYLKFSRSLLVEHVNDPAHRSHNDVHLALAAAGLLTFGLMSFGLYNVRYGPWNKGTWFGKVQQTADEMSRSMSASDPLLVTFFPDILADEGRSQEENTVEHRRLFLESLPNRSFVRAKGSKASPSRFNSLSIAHAELDPEWSSFCLVLAVLCINEGWVKKASDLWSPDAPGTSEQAATTRAAAKSAARKALAQQRSRTVNTLHSMTTFACNADNRSLARTVFFVLQPEGLRCSKMLEELRSPESTVRYFSEWAHWGYMATAREHVGRFSDLALVQRVGLDMSMDSPLLAEAALAWQDCVARRLAKLTQRLLRYRCGSQLPSTNGWGATAGLLHDSIACRQASLRFLDEVDKVVRKVKEEGSLEAKSLLEGHPATAPLLALVLGELRAGAFVEVDPDTQDFLRRLWAGLLNSKLVEDGNKVQREAEQRNGSNKTLGRVEGWHGLSRSLVLKSYERPEVATVGMAELPGGFQAEDWFVRRKRVRQEQGQSSTGAASSSSRATRASEEEDIFVGVSSTRTWASHTPESQQDNLASFSLLAKVVREKRDWSFVEKGWWASLLPEGCGLAFEGCPPCFVVRSYKRAALVWPATLEPLGDGSERLVLQADVASLCWVHTFDDNVVVLDLAATSPLRAL
ncbi:Camkk2 [Symbiodinium sp. CCMP2592]|nr:Camkk2 [Symbiodinium sp. CCMP2592]